MPIVRAARLGSRARRLTLLAACVAAGLALCSCADSRLSNEPAAGVSLAGPWKLDRAASDDPQKLLATMRAQAIKIISRHQAAMAAAPPPVRGGRPDTDYIPPEEDPLFAPGPDGRRPDPLKRSPMAQVIMQTDARGDFLTVRQSPDEMMFDFGTSRRSFTPGGRSVVSTETGVGDQISGWKGGEYVIEIKGQLGPNVTETYALSPDKQELIDKLHISAGELPAVSLTRIYRPTTEIAPQQLPSTN
jgi:hypothetical protein